MRVVAGAPPGLLEAINKMRSEARARYGEPLIEVGPAGNSLRATVALPSQEEELRRLSGEFWPGAAVHILVLATRRARLALYPDAGPLDVWRRPRQGSADRGELTTQLLPGDPPAGLLAVRPGRYLVRAPGDALGWVLQTARFRLGPSPTPDAGGDGLVGGPSWDPGVVLKTALGLLGREYVWGGTGGPGVDCSGLSWRAYLAAGVLLPRNSRAQRRVGAKVRLADLQQADLICAVYRGPKRTSHLALALGPDEVIHACSEWHQVRREPLADFRARYQVLTVRRLPGALPSGR